MVSSDSFQESIASAAMARVASTSTAIVLPRLHPQSSQSPGHLNLSFHLQNRNHRFPQLFCQTNPDAAESATSEEKQVVEPGSEIDSRPANTAVSETAPPTSPGFPQYPDKKFNMVTAAVSTFAAVGIFLSARLDFGVSLKDLSAAALPYEEALSNGKPTVVEFYADWCEICRELAPEVYKVEQQYKDRVILSC